MTAYIVAFYDIHTGNITDLKVLSDPDISFFDNIWGKVIGKVKSDDYHTASGYAWDALDRMRKISCKTNVSQFNSVIEIDKRT